MPPIIKDIKLKQPAKDALKWHYDYFLAEFFFITSEALAGCFNYFSYPW